MLTLVTWTVRIKGQRAVDRHHELTTDAPSVFNRVLGTEGNHGVKAEVVTDSQLSTLERLVNDAEVYLQSGKGVFNASFAQALGLKISETSNKAIASNEQRVAIADAIGMETDDLLKAIKLDMLHADHKRISDSVAWHTKKLEELTEELQQIEDEMELLTLPVPVS